MTAKKPSPVWPRVLFAVLKAPRTLSEACRVAGARDSDVKKALDHMIEEGFVTKTPHPSHKQSSIYTWVGIDT